MPEAMSKRAPAVTRAIAILRRLGSATEPMGVNRLARELDLVPSTCLHILRVLVEEGLVDVDEASKRYAIGAGILPIARNAIQRNDFAMLAQPRLVELSRGFGVTGIATQLIQDRHMVVVALAPAQQAFRLSTELGSRFPTLTSATGRCVAAFGALDETALRERFDRLIWDNPPAFEAWMAQVDETRRNGFGVDRGEYINGVGIVAVPVFDGAGRMTRSLVAIGLVDRIESEGAATIAAAMLRMRDEISSRLVAN